MPAEARAAGAAPDAGFLGRFGWAMFDWANQPIFSVITTFIFAPYFTSFVVADPVRGQALWGYAQSAAGVLIAVASPFLGAMADAAGPRKGWTFVFQVPCVICAAALWWVTPASGPETWTWALAAIAVMTVGAEISVVFNNAMLPDLVPHERLGRLSGYAWGLGYVGGLIALTTVLVCFSLPDQPWFGLDKAMHENDRVVGPLVAVWIVVFDLPLFLFTPDQPHCGIGRAEAARQGARKVFATVAKLGRYRNIALFLIARMIAYDGLSAVFAFGGIYAAGMFGWGTTSLGIFGIVIIVFAAIGAAVGGWLDDRIGSKPTIQGALVGVTFATFGILSMTHDSVLFGIAVDGPVQGGALFASSAERAFMLFAVIIGLCSGPMQAAARTMMARLAPPDMLGEFFGLYALTGKATAFFAPLAIAIMTDAFASQRAGIFAIVVFLVAGFVLMMPVREERAA
ncbi:MAG TPA: MFS transporter [Candidatus Cybelea sp.]|nr:MFS transporter [Candidatus Cybelea sp.]